ncbi:MAG: 4Fe-4S binding protein [Deltaproteobacteria bacterium]|nr:4Fe-4S binding protein [Deltaproteobacteria bacterium]
MAKRKIVRIDEEKCTGCGLCVPSCAEGAIQIINGKARLIADNLCDGLGACLGDCPEDAITIEERDADDFDETAVAVHMRQGAVKSPVAHQTPVSHGHNHGHMGGCPGARTLTFDAGESVSDAPHVGKSGPIASKSALRQWPIQMHLVSPTAPYYIGADVLLAADCVAFSLWDFHRSYLQGKALAVACPKLDDGQETYVRKLVAMIEEAKINTLTVMIMEVPCCTGLLGLAREAVSRASRKVPVKKIVVSLKGELLSEDWVQI